MITKGQAIVGGAVVIGSSVTVGVVLSKNKGQQTDNVSEDPIQKFGLLVDESNFLSDYSTEDTIGKKYGWYLTGTYGVSTKDNEKWWNDSYDRWMEDLAGNSNSLSDVFNGKEKIELGFSPKETVNSKALNQVCDGLYKKELGDFEFKTQADNDKSKLGRDLLRYCSPLLKKPSTIAEAREESQYSRLSDSSDFFGKTYKDVLISASEDSNNDLFWELRNREFLGKEGIQGTGYGLDESKDSLFHRIYSNNEDNETVYQLCVRFYTYNDSYIDGLVKKETIFKFCTWDAQQPTN